MAISRPGQSNLAGDALALFLKVFSGEVLTEFETNLVFKDKHFMRQIANGKSAQFPMVGKSTINLHTPGNDVTEDVVGHAEKVITIGSKVTAAHRIADIDEAMNHYDIRAPYSTEMGRALAKHYDYNVALSMLLAARSANPLTSRAGGTVLTDPDYASSGEDLEAALFTAAETLDVKDVPMGETRYAYFRPAQFYLLAQREKLISKDLGGSGEISKGSLATVAGISLVKTNQVPAIDETANAKLETHLRLNAATTVGLIGTPMAAGSVQLMALQTEAERRIEKQDWFMVSGYVTGHDFLRPDCAIELKTA